MVGRATEAKPAPLGAEDEATLVTLQQECQETVSIVALLQPFIVVMHVDVLILTVGEIGLQTDKTQRREHFLMREVEHRSMFEDMGERPLDSLAGTVEGRDDARRRTAGHCGVGVHSPMVSLTYLSICAS